MQSKLEKKSFFALWPEVFVFLVSDHSGKGGNDAREYH